MTLNEAIEVLKRYVKFSNVPGQKHISPDLVNADDLPTYQEAMITTQRAVALGELKSEELKDRIGL